jgi:hypothetical protein
LGAESTGVSSSSARLDTRRRQHPAATTAGAIATSWNSIGMVRTVLVTKRWERRKKTRQG